jgi:hypothetical protein
VGGHRVKKAAGSGEGGSEHGQQRGTFSHLQQLLDEQVRPPPFPIEESSVDHVHTNRPDHLGRDDDIEPSHNKLQLLLLFFCI